MKEIDSHQEQLKLLRSIDTTVKVIAFCVVLWTVIPLMAFIAYGADRFEGLLIGIAVVAFPVLLLVIFYYARKQADRYSGPAQRGEPLHDESGK